MATKQSRGQKLRRVVSINAPATRPDLAVRYNQAIGARLYVEGLTFAQPPNGAAVVVPLVVRGVPQILRLLDNTYPTSAAGQEDGIHVYMDYPGAPIAAGELFRVGLSDPAVRSRTGSYLAQGTGSFNTDPPLIITPAATATGPNTIEVTFDIRYAYEMTMRADGWLDVTTNDQPSVVSMGAGASLVLTFASPIASGDQLRYMTTAPVTVNGAMYVPRQGIVTVA